MVDTLPGVWYILLEELYRNYGTFGTEVFMPRQNFMTISVPDTVQERRIWLKLKNVREERNIKASMLKITSSGRDLKDVISVGQFHFGYVSFKR